MSIAAILQRAKAAAAAISTTEVDAAWPPGARVGLVLPTRLGSQQTGLRGRVAFVEGGWIYWAAEDGHVHASRPDALRRLV